MDQQFTAQVQGVGKDITRSGDFPAEHDKQWFATESEMSESSSPSSVILTSSSEEEDDDDTGWPDDALKAEERMRKAAANAAEEREKAAEHEHLLGNPHQALSDGAVKPLDDHATAIQTHARGSGQMDNNKSGVPGERAAEQEADPDATANRQETVMPGHGAKIQHADGEAAERSGHPSPVGVSLEFGIQNLALSGELYSPRAEQSEDARLEGSMNADEFGGLDDDGDDVLRNPVLQGALMSPRIDSDREKSVMGTMDSEENPPHEQTTQIVHQCAKEILDRLIDDVELFCTAGSERPLYPAEADALGAASYHAENKDDEPVLCGVLEFQSQLKSRRAVLTADKSVGADAPSWASDNPVENLALSGALYSPRAESAPAIASVSISPQSGDDFVWKAPSFKQKAPPSLTGGAVKALDEHATVIQARARGMIVRKQLDSNSTDGNEGLRLAAMAEGVGKESFVEKETRAEIEALRRRASIASSLGSIDESAGEHAASAAVADLSDDLHPGSQPSQYDNPALSGELFSPRATRDVTEDGKGQGAMALLLGMAGETPLTEQPVTNAALEGALFSPLAALTLRTASEAEEDRQVDREASLARTKGRELTATLESGELQADKPGQTTAVFAPQGLVGAASRADDDDDAAEQLLGDPNVDNLALSGALYSPRASQHAAQAPETITGRAEAMAVPPEESGEESAASAVSNAVLEGALFSPRAAVMASDVGYAPEASVEDDASESAVVENAALDGVLYSPRCAPSPTEAVAEDDLLREGSMLVEQLDEGLGQEVIEAVRRGESPLAAALRKRATETREEGLLREGRALVERLDEELSAQVIEAVVRGQSPLAATLRQRVGEAEEEHLLQEGTVLLERLDPGLSDEVIDAVATGESPLAANLRRRVGEVGEEQLLREGTALVEQLDEELGVEVMEAVRSGQSHVAAKLRTRVSEEASRIAVEGDEDRAGGSELTPTCSDSPQQHEGVADEGQSTDAVVEAGRNAVTDGTQVAGADETPIEVVDDVHAGGEEDGETRSRAEEHKAGDGTDADAEASSSDDEPRQVSAPRGAQSQQGETDAAAQAASGIGIQVAPLDECEEGAIDRGTVEAEAETAVADATAETAGAGDALLASVLSMYLGTEEQAPARRDENPSGTDGELESTKGDFVAPEGTERQEGVRESSAPQPVDSDVPDQGMTDLRDSDEEVSQHLGHAEDQETESSAAESEAASSVLSSSPPSSPDSEAERAAAAEREGLRDLLGAIEVLSLHATPGMFAADESESSLLDDTQILHNEISESSRDTTMPQVRGFPTDAEGEELALARADDSRAHGRERYSASASAESGINSPHALPPIQIPHQHPQHVKSASHQDTHIEELPTTSHKPRGQTKPHDAAANLPDLAQQTAQESRTASSSSDLSLPMEGSTSYVEARQEAQRRSQSVHSAGGRGTWTKEPRKDARVRSGNAVPSKESADVNQSEDEPASAPDEAHVVEDGATAENASSSVAFEGNQQQSTTDNATTEQIPTPTLPLASERTVVDREAQTDCKSVDVDGVEEPAPQQPVEVKAEGSTQAQRHVVSAFGEGDALAACDDETVDSIPSPRRNSAPAGVTMARAHTMPSAARAPGQAIEGRADPPASPAPPTSPLPSPIHTAGSVTPDRAVASPVEDRFVSSPVDELTPLSERSTRRVDMYHTPGEAALHRLFMRYCIEGNPGNLSTAFDSTLSSEGHSRKTARRGPRTEMGVEGVLSVMRSLGLVAQQTEGGGLEGRVKEGVVRGVYGNVSRDPTLAGLRGGGVGAVGWVGFRQCLGMSAALSCVPEVAGVRVMQLLGIGSLRYTSMQSIGGWGDYAETRTSEVVLEACKDAALNALVAAFANEEVYGDPYRFCAKWDGHPAHHKSEDAAMVPQPPTMPHTSPARPRTTGSRAVRREPADPEQAQGDSGRRMPGVEELVAVLRSVGACPALAGPSMVLQEVRNVVKGEKDARKPAPPLNRSGSWDGFFAGSDSPFSTPGGTPGSSPFAVSTARHSPLSSAMFRNSFSRIHDRPSTPTRMSLTLSQFQSAFANIVRRVGPPAFLRATAIHCADILHSMPIHQVRSPVYPTTPADSSQEPEEEKGSLCDQVKAALKAKFKNVAEAWVFFDTQAGNVVSRSGMALGLRRIGMGHIDVKALIREVDKNSIDGTVDEHEFRGNFAWHPTEYFAYEAMMQDALARRREISRRSFYRSGEQRPQTAGSNRHRATPPSTPREAKNGQADFVHAARRPVWKPAGRDDCAATPSFHGVGGVVPSSFLTPSSAISTPMHNRPTAWYSDSQFSVASPGGGDHGHAGMSQWERQLVDRWRASQGGSRTSGPQPASSSDRPGGGVGERSAERKLREESARKVDRMRAVYSSGESLGSAVDKVVGHMLDGMDDDGSKPERVDLHFSGGRVVRWERDGKGKKQIAHLVPTMQKGGRRGRLVPRIAVEAVSVSGTETQSSESRTRKGSRKLAEAERRLRVLKNEVEAARRKYGQMYPPQETALTFCEGKWLYASVATQAVSVAGGQTPVLANLSRRGGQRSEAMWQKELGSSEYAKRSIMEGLAAGDGDGGGAQSERNSGSREQDRWPAEMSDRLDGEDWELLEALGADPMTKGDRRGYRGQHEATSRKGAVSSIQDDDDDAEMLERMMARYNRLAATSAPAAPPSHT